MNEQKIENNVKVAEAIKHFGELDKKPFSVLLVDDSDMHISNGQIKVGCYAISAKSKYPVRITIDVDPKHPNILIRTTSRES